MDSMDIKEVGSYAKKQLLAKNFLLTWSHGSRYKFAVDLVRRMKPHTVIDYGCGDGTFLYLLGDRGTKRIGLDYNQQQIAECKKRFLDSTEFYSTDDFQWNIFGDVITCMEVIEHCTLQQRLEVYGRIQKMMNNDARVVFSVPIEIGPTILVKNFVRWVMSMRGVNGYEQREKFRWIELLKMLFASKNTKIDRPIYSQKLESGEIQEWHGHKGFNWRQFRLEIAQKFDLEEIYYTPIDHFNGFFSSQVWFICRKKSVHKNR
jgi:2-polyprenyl-3-methyl-5-hydroxy-6-metoxy-1,4-benzoquinol methylase